MVQIDQTRDRPGNATPPWLASYPSRIDWSADIPVEPLTDALDRSVAKHGDRLCLEFLGRGYRYREIGDLVDRAAKGLQALGVGKGTRVGLFLPNSPAFVVAYYAILKAGGIVVNFNPLYALEEVCQQIADAQAEVMITMDLKLLLPKVQAAVARTGLRHVIVASMAEALPRSKGILFRVLKRSDCAAVPRGPTYSTFRALVDNDGAYTPVAIDPRRDTAVFQYTGGTTGLPKGAMLTHAGLSANRAQVANWCPELVDGGERILAVLPLFHVFAMTSVMNLSIAKAGCMVLLPRFDLLQVLRTIVRTRPTIFAAVPSLLNAINHHPRIASFDLSCLRFCISGGAALPAEVKRAFEARTGCAVVEGYGLTEAGPVCTCNPIGAVAPEESIGLPLQGTEIEIRDPADPDRILPPGEPGEICVRGPQIMLGYWNRAQETAATLRNGLLHTGDIGYIDPRGYVFLIDRLKDVILTNGYNVYPRSIEEAIYTHPAVAECCVIGIDDPERGQSAKAFVVCSEGESLSETGLRAFLEEKISPIEMPRAVEFRNALPKTPIGKISKKELIAEEKEKHSKSQSVLD